MSNEKFSIIVRISLVDTEITGEDKHECFNKARELCLRLGMQQVVIKAADDVLTNVDDIEDGDLITIEPITVMSFGDNSMPHTMPDTNFGGHDHVKAILEYNDTMLMLPSSRRYYEGNICVIGEVPERNIDDRAKEYLVVRKTYSNEVHMFENCDHDNLLGWHKLTEILTPIDMKDATPFWKAVNSGKYTLPDFTESYYPIDEDDDADLDFTREISTYIRLDDGSLYPVALLFCSEEIAMKAIAKFRWPDLKDGDERVQLIKRVIAFFS